MRGQRSRSERRSAAPTNGRCRCEARNGFECCLLPPSGRKETRASLSRWSDLRTFGDAARGIKSDCKWPSGDGHTVERPWVPLEQNLPGALQPVGAARRQTPCLLASRTGKGLWDLPKTLAYARGRPPRVSALVLGAGPLLERSTSAVSRRTHYLLVTGESRVTVSIV